jgi:hypothetical protein
MTQLLIPRLPEGWTVEMHQSCVMLVNNERHRYVGIPVPYTPRPSEWWQKQADEAIAKAEGVPNE